MRPAHAIDAAVVLFLVAALFFYPWHFDEGWVDLTILNARTTGVYGYVLDNGGVPYSFVKPWFALLNLFCFPSLGQAHVFLMRVPGLLLALVGWAAIRSALSRLSLDSTLARTLAAFFWATSSAEFLVDLRPEAAYVPALAVALLLSLQWTRAARLGSLFSGLAVTALAVGTHPCAVLVPLVLAAALPFGRPNFSWRDGYRIAAAVAVTAIVSAMMLLWDQSPAMFLRSLNAAANLDHTIPWYYEWARYLDFGWRLPALAACLFMGLLAVPLLLFSARIPSRTRAVLLAQILVVAAFLTFYPAKWHYYLAVYIPWLAISWAQFGETLTTLWRRFAMLRGAALIVTGFAALMIAADHAAPHFSLGDATLLRSAVLEPLFGLPRTAQEKAIDEIPELANGRRVLVELYMFPMLNVFALNAAHFDDVSPPAFMVTHVDIVPRPLEVVPYEQKWATTPWAYARLFRFQGETVAVIRPFVYPR